MWILFLVFASVFTAEAFRTPPGMIVKMSENGAVETINKLEGILKKKGLTVFGRVSHHENAAMVNATLRPTELIIFGNPKLGTQLMLEAQSVGIDLPMKAIAWTDESGKTWIGYNRPDYLAWRHDAYNDVIKKMTGALDKLTTAAASK